MKERGFLRDETRRERILFALFFKDLEKGGCLYVVFVFVLSISRSQRRSSKSPLPLPRGTTPSGKFCEGTGKAVSADSFSLLHFVQVAHLFNPRPRKKEGKEDEMKMVMKLPKAPNPPPGGKKEV